MRKFLSSWWWALCMAVVMSLAIGAPTLFASTRPIAFVPTGTGVFVASAGVEDSTAQIVAPGIGGTGQDFSASTGAVVFSSGTASAVSPGTLGNVLTSNGTTWASATPAAGGISATQLFFSLTKAYVAQGVNSTAGNFTLGTTFYAAAGATVKGVRVALKVAGGGSHSIKVSICDPNGTLQASAFAAIPDDVATEIDFATPYVIATLLTGSVNPWVVGAYELSGTWEVRMAGAQAAGVNPSIGAPVPWNASGVTWYGASVNAGGDSCPNTTFSVPGPIDPVFQ